VAEAPAQRPHLRKQLYIIFSEPASDWGAEKRHTVHGEHLAHQYDIEARGIMFAAGPFIDEAGKPQGPGMIIVRAANEAEARAIADADPYHKLGYRKYRLQKWSLNEGSFGLKIRFSDGAHTID
jgi:uncharacterized protein YciI